MRGGGGGCLESCALRGDVGYTHVMAEVSEGSGGGRRKVQETIYGNSDIEIANKKRKRENLRSAARVLFLISCGRSAIDSVITAARTCVSPCVCVPQCDGTSRMR